MAGVGTVVSSLLNPGSISTSTARASTGISSSSTRTSTKVTTSSSILSTTSTSVSTSATSSFRSATPSTSSEPLLPTTVVVVTLTTTTTQTTLPSPASSSSSAPSVLTGPSVSLSSSISTTPVSVTSSSPSSTPSTGIETSILSSSGTSSGSSVSSTASMVPILSSSSILSAATSPGDATTSWSRSSTTSPSTPVSPNAANDSQTIATSPSFVSFSSSSSSLKSSLVSYTSSSTSPVRTPVLSQPGDMNPLASNNVAAYFGHATGTYNSSLAELCNSTNVDIIILGFVRWWWPKLYYPDIDFHTTCDSQDVAESRSTPRCPQMASWISNCQGVGKKVFLSIGGSNSNTTFSTAQDALNAAMTIWYYFGEGNTLWNARPFGTIVLDGYDFDLESGSVQYYDIFAAQLRQYFAQGTRKYYISAAPSCANKTASLSNPLGDSFYQQADFVWPRFYNYLACSIGNAGFNSSFYAWASYLGSVQGWAPEYPKLYASAFSWNCNKTGWLNRTAFAAAIAGAKNVTRASGIFGGVMLWDGTKGVQNVADGVDSLVAAKLALNSSLV